MANKRDDPAELAAHAELLRRQAHARDARMYADTAAGRPIRHGGTTVSDDVGLEVDEEDLEPPTPAPAGRPR